MTDREKDPALALILPESCAVPSADDGPANAPKNAKSPERELAERKLADVLEHLYSGHPLTEREKDRARALILGGRGAWPSAADGPALAAEEAKSRVFAAAERKAVAQANSRRAIPKAKKAAREAAQDDAEEAARTAVVAWNAQWSERVGLVERFFEGLTSIDLSACIREFRFAEEAEHRKECAQLLIAYFMWCKSSNCGAVRIDPRESWPRDFMGDVDHYILEFVSVAFKRMTDLPPDLGGFDLPKWDTPNAGFGWNHLAHCPPRDRLFRNVGILAFIELQRRQGKAPAAGARLAREKFSQHPGKPLTPANIDSILHEFGRDLDRWTPLPDSDDQLRSLADPELQWAADQRRSKTRQETEK